jgi:hypothetical protein
MSDRIEQIPDGAAQALPDVAGGYAPEHEHRPLTGYLVLSAAFAATFGGSLAGAHRHAGELPERIETRDVVLIGIATHKVTRLLAKDRVTSFLRAPFAQYQDRAGHGEVEEKARGRGLRLATGELLICPYCLAQWVVGGFAVGMVAAPRLTRLLAGMWTAEAISDFAQLAYHAAEERS